MDAVSVVRRPRGDRPGRFPLNLSLTTQLLNKKVCSSYNMVISVEKSKCMAMTGKEVLRSKFVIDTHVIE